MNEEQNDEKREIAILGGGCFWCTEAVLSCLRGVEKVEPDYCGGHVEHPGYDQVCQENTGHVEVVRVTFKPRYISFNDLLTVFFATHDPTTLNRQGADVGPQYASSIFCQTPGQKETAQTHLNQLQQTLSRPIVTRLLPAHPFWLAEKEHHDYYQNHPQQPYCQIVISPKMAALQQRFAALLAAAP